MPITINETLRAYIDPLTEDEARALERSLLAEGGRDALVLWGDVLVDGHNRYRICQKHNIPFETVQNTAFKTMEDVFLWMIDNHLGRRSVSDFQRGILALRKKEIIASRIARQAQATGSAGAVAANEASGPAQDASLAGSGKQIANDDGPPWSREEVARAARVSPTTLSQIEKIQKMAAPERVEAVKTGTISINAAAAVASLPSQAQAEAAAGGKKQLHEAARQVRQSRQPQRPAADLPDLPGDATPEQREIHRLTAALAAMTQERDSLRKKVQHLTIALSEARCAGAE